MDVITKMKCDEWFVDSGATHHITNRREWFTEYTPFKNPKMMDSAKNGVCFQALGSGSIQVTTYDGHSWKEQVFKDVWLCPEGALNLFSMKKAGQKGIDQYIWENGLQWIFHRDGETIAIAVSPGENNLYRMAVSHNTGKDLHCKRHRRDTAIMARAFRSSRPTACNEIFEGPRDSGHGTHYTQL